MKILYFSGTKVPSQNAQSVHCMKMAEAFAHARHNVTLFAKGVSGAEQTEIFEAYGTDDIFELELSTFVNIPLISGAARWMDMTGRVWRMEKPDLVYGADPVALALLCPSGAKIVFEAHTLPESSSAKNWAFLKLIRQPNFKGIVVTSDILKQDFLDKYTTLDSEKIFVAHDGADLINRLSRHTVEPVLIKGRSDAFKIGYVGSLHTGKGISHIAKLAALRPDYEFHIVGGTERHLLKHQAEYFSSNLHFYGHRNHAEIPSYLAAFNALLAPYQHTAVVKTGYNTSRWLSPIKIFEYMAAQKPILCSDLPVLQEILQNEHNALLLPPSDEAAWARTLDRLKSNPSFAKELAENAYLDLARKYTWDKRALAVLSFIAERPQIFRQLKAS